MSGYNDHMSDSNEIERPELEQPQPAEKLPGLEKAKGVDAYEDARKAEKTENEKAPLPENLDSMERIDEAITHIQPELEERRQKFMHFFMIGLLGLVSAVTLGFAQFDGPLRNSTLSIIIISLVGSILLFHGINMFYRISSKKKFLTALSEFTGLIWDKKGVFPISDIEPHCVLPLFDKGSTKDGFEGRYKNIPLSFQEVILADIEPDPNNSRNTREYVAFWGLVVRIKLRRPLSAHTVVMPDNALHTFFRTRFSHFKKINIVSNKFEKKYDVMGTDQVEGRVILDPAFIERFMKTGDMLKSHWIEASFKGEEVVFVIRRTRPLFDIGHIWTKLDEERLHKTTKEINSVLRIIDVLKLNPQVGI